ncbi:Uncharacterized protein AXF42_Ash017010 [Apostasia shenzhenica]|uniref:Uncharacterized protein n=1 Tax=Apostasia shenzhenica TaxID=1088818 RepID=A0A2I0B7F2_9ASPA|nr:Uncharacterized protein AXF42_Ash017010 [Apostasia shenzhenica]
MPGSDTTIQPPVKATIVSAKALACHPDSQLHSGRRLQTRRRSRRRGLPVAGGIWRSQSYAASGRGSGPVTPLLRWKFEDAERSSKQRPVNCNESCRKPKNPTSRSAVSARKLASGIWHLQLTGAGSGGVSRGEAGGARNGLEFTSAAFLNPAMEKATKWDTGCMKTSKEVFQFASQLKLLEDRKISTASIVSSLQTELEGAQARIYELEAERQSAKKKLHHFLRKLAEERSLWCTREHDKIRAIVDDMKSDLNRERKNRQRVEIVNTKLVNELADVKLSAKRLFKDYEKEKKARELMEEVCNELAKEIGEDKAEVEALKKESIKIREEVEEERKMLQMAEVWREERVQMKLLDAKLALEHKYSKLSELQAELDAFLSARMATGPDIGVIRVAELLKEAVDFVKIEEMKEFSYQPPASSEDIFAVFEELQPKEENHEKDIEPCYGFSPTSHESKTHSVSPATEVFLEKPTGRYSNSDMEEEDTGWETLSPGEEQESSNSLGGSEPSVNGKFEEIKGENCKGNSEVAEIYLANDKQSRKIGASLARLWRSSCSIDAEIDNKNSTEMKIARLSDGRMSNVALSPDNGFHKIGLSPPRVDQWCSPDSLYPHSTRGMKGCIEWPRGLQKHSLKAKLLEARMESQKTQLRHRFALIKIVILQITGLSWRKEDGQNPFVKWDLLAVRNRTGPRGRWEKR